MSIVNAIHKLSDGVNEVCAVFCTITISAMVLVTGAQILGRLYFTPLVWSEELTRYLLVWSTFLGASCVYKRLGHINVTAIKDLFPPAAQRAMEVTAHLLCGAFFLLAAWYGIKYMGLQSRQVSAAMLIPMPFIYTVIPLGCCIMTLHVVDILLRLVSRPEAKADSMQGGGQ